MRLELLPGLLRVGYSRNPRNRFRDEGAGTMGAIGRCLSPALRHWLDTHSVEHVLVMVRQEDLRSRFYIDIPNEDQAVLFRMRWL